MRICLFLFLFVFFFFLKTISSFITIHSPLGYVTIAGYRKHIYATAGNGWMDQISSAACVELVMSVIWVNVQDIALAYRSALFLYMLCCPWTCRPRFLTSSLRGGRNVLFICHSNVGLPTKNNNNKTKHERTCVDHFYSTSSNTKIIGFSGPRKK